MNRREWLCGPPGDRASEPPRPVGVRRNKPLVFIGLGGDVIGAKVHYLAETRAYGPCLGAKCLACGAGLGKMWRGYVAACFPRSKRLFVAEVTEAAARQLLLWMRAPEWTLRGRLLEMRRTGEGKTSKVSVTDHGTTPALEVPPAFSVIEALEEEWGLNEPGSPLGEIERAVLEGEEDVPC